MLMAVRIMLSCDIVLRFTSIMRSSCARPAALPSPSCLALLVVLLSVSLASRDCSTRGTTTASFADTGRVSGVVFADRASLVLGGGLFGSKIIHEWLANPVYE